MLIHAMVICASRLIELENIPSYATQNDAHNSKATTPANYLHVLGCIEDLDSRVCLIHFFFPLVCAHTGTSAYLVSCDTSRFSGPFLRYYLM